VTQELCCCHVCPVTGPSSDLNTARIRQTVINLVINREMPNANIVFDKYMPECPPHTSYLFVSGTQSPIRDV